MSSFLKDFFDAAYLINLKRRRDRLVHVFIDVCEEIGGWPFYELKVIADRWVSRTRTRKL